MSLENMLRILNIGNTHIQIIDSDGAEFILRETLPTCRFDSLPEEWFDCPLAVSSVVPALTAEMKRRGAFVVSARQPLPFRVSGLDISTVGADRLANAAALQDGPLPALAVDFGTAITLEYVTAGREFAGGAILPGRLLLRKALHDYTAQLPLIPLSEETAEIPGRNTADAMRIGTDSASLGAVRELIREWRGLCPGQSLRIVACGGDRGFFLKHLDGLTDGGDFFTIRGIRRLWEHSHHES